MKLLFDTNSISIQLYWQLFQKIKSKKKIKSAFSISDKNIYTNFLKFNKNFNNKNNNNLFEWKINELAKNKNYDLGYLKNLEKEFNNTFLINSIFADRRLMYSENVKFIQDYKLKNDHDFLLSYLYNACKQIENQLNSFNPKMILAFNFVNTISYLYYLFSRARNIKYYQLKLTRIENFVSFHDNPLTFPSELEKKYNENLKNNLSQISREEEEILYNFINKSRDKQLSYEGSILLEKNSNKKNFDKINETNSKYISCIDLAKKNNLDKLKEFFFLKKNEEGYPSSLKFFIYNKIIKSLKKKKNNQFFSKLNDIDNKFQYAFFPLNTEPEVALLVYGKNFKNQIETIRNISTSLPINFKLIVKEHPNAIGFRSSNYYKKILDIPNVVLVGANEKASEIIKLSKIVFVTYGTIGLETIIKKKPLINFSKYPYGLFPKTMVDFTQDFGELRLKILNLLKNYVYEEKYLISYISSIISTSFRLNLSTQLLGKSGRTSFGKSNLENQYEILSDEIIKRYKNDIDD